MKRIARVATAVSLIIAGMMCESVRALNPVNKVTWVGGASGLWNDAGVWKNTTTNTTGTATDAAIFGQKDGSNGMNNVDPASTRARNIVLDGGVTVDYNAQTQSSDFRILQGSNFTITGGATWQQVTDLSYNGNRWTNMEPSNLVIDNGTLRRVGETNKSVPDHPPNTPDGGGALIFGDYRGDDNYARLGNNSEEINVTLKNGGKIENQGQMWFGCQDDNPVNLRVKFTINNGSMDLTGGTITQINDSYDGVGDLVFMYDYDEIGGAPKNEKYEINFTGPGSITVDTAGIRVYEQDSSSIWNVAAPATTYEDLWARGILKANGLSGATTQPATFSNFFTVTGTAGSDNYKLTSITNPIATIKWVGGASGLWNDAGVWKNTTTNTTGTATDAAIFGQKDGSNGMNNVDPASTRARNIVLDGGVTVDYNAQTQSSDFRILQGSNFTITGGATWQQVTDLSYNGNRWTNMEPSNLVIDNGTLRRVGETNKSVPDHPPNTPDGGGALIFGDYRGDDNYARLGNNSEEINVTLKNGGKIENQGQMWFGCQDDNPVNLRVKFTINNGSMDLTGGTITQINDSYDGVGDLVFMYDYDEIGGAPKNEKYEINFTGPGSITVDTAGIRVYEQDSSSIWNVAAPATTYEDLWARGILKANGLSGATTQPATFSNFFTVTGTAGSDNYILTSLIGLTGDYNGDGMVDGADYVTWRKNPANFGGAAGYTAWRGNYGNMAASGAGLTGAAVPEPGTALLLLVGLISFLSTKQRVR